MDRDDVLFEIFTYLNPYDLNNAKLCNKLYYNLIRNRDKELYLPFVEQLWTSQDRKFNVPLVSHYNILQRIQQLPLLQLRRELLGIDTSRCVEKLDYQRMLRCKLMFGKKSNLLRSRRLSLNHRSAVFYPDWALTLDEYQASFIYTMNEINSTRAIYKSELCLISWRFRFKHYDENDNQAFNWVSRFKTDYTMHSEFQDHEYTWQFVVGNDDIVRVQVDQYPPLTTIRLPNGQWRMENMYVWFTQVETIPPEDLPIV